MLMASVFNDLRDPASEPRAGALLAAPQRRGEFQVGETTCYDVTQSSTRRHVIDRLNDSFPHVIRVIGSLPGNTIVSMVRKQLLQAVLHSKVGAVLIGGNETTKASSPGERVDSVPGLAVPLQQLSYRSSIYGNMLDVYGTLPIGRQSIVTEEQLDILGSSEPDLRVKMQRDLKRALVFPTLKDNVWTAEAEGVVQTVHSFLRQNLHARYSVVMVGGGTATELEYQEIQSLLSSEFGDRIRIIPIAGSGGFSDKLARSASNSNCLPVKIASAGLKRALKDVSSDIPLSDYRHEQLVAAERRVVTIADNQRQLMQTTAEDPKVINERSKELDAALANLRRSGIVEDLVNLSDRIEFPAEDSKGLGDRLRNRVLSTIFSRVTLKIQSLDLRAGNTALPDPLLPKVVNLLQYAGKSIYREGQTRGCPDNARTPKKSVLSEGDVDLANRLFSSLTSTRDMPSGELLSCSGQPLAIVDTQEGGRSLLSADGSIYPPDALAGVNIEVRGNVVNETLSGRPLQSTPETIPTWGCLENHGGLIRFKDAHGRVIGHREILLVKQAKAEEGELQRSLYRLVTALDVTYTSKTTQLIRSIEHVNSLIFPSADKPEAIYVEVFPFTQAVRVGAPLPPPYIDRASPSRISSLMKPVNSIVHQIESCLIETGVSRATNRIQYLATNPNSENMSALTGEDPVFEHLLADQRENANALKEFSEVTVAIFEYLSRIQPEALNKIVTALEAKQKTGIAIQELFPFFTNQMMAIVGTSPDESLHKLASAALHLSDTLQSTLTADYLVGAEISDFTSRVIGRRSITMEVAEDCAYIASQAVIDFAAGGAEEFYKLKSAGGMTTNRYTTAYILQAVQSGARLIQIQNSRSNSTEGFSLYFPPGAISERQREANPLLKDLRCGYYDLVCMRQGTSLPTGSLIAIRSALVELQYRDTDFLAATIHQWNEASMKSALRDQFAPISSFESQVFTKQVGNGFESRLNSWRCPVSPRFRTTLRSVRIDDRRERLAVINHIKEQGGGFLNATQEERRQMMWIASSNQELPYVRLSVGVASMTDKAVADFQYLIDQGTFSGEAGVFCLASTREATKTDAGWILHERGPHEILQRMKRNFHSDSTFVGLAVSDTKDRNFGRSIEITMLDGESKTFPIAYTETDDGKKVTVVDRRDIPIINSPVTTPEKYKGGLDLFHIEQLRAREFGEMFRSQLYMFTGGGGVNAWYIKDLVESLATNEDAHTRVVLLKGFGGSTDLLAENIDWCRHYQSLINQGRLIIIEPLSSEEQRLKLKQVLSDAAKKARFPKD